MVVDLFRYMALTIGIVNICLLIGLLYVYLKTYQRVKAPFTIGLVFFVSLVLAETILSTISIFIFREFRPPPPQPAGSLVGSQLVQNIFRCIAYSILLKISWE